MLLTCHTPDFEPARLARMMADALDSSAEHGGRDVIDARPLTIRAATGRELPSGVAVRVLSPSVRVPLPPGEG